MFLKPKTEPDVVLIVPWDNWNAQYSLYEARINYGDFTFDERNISCQDIEETITQANQILTDFRGVLSKRERMRTLVMSILFAVFIIWAIVSGLKNDTYVRSMFIIILYLVLLYVVNQVIKYKSSY